MKIGILLFASIVTLSQTVRAQDARISGIVVDSLHNEPLADARISIGGTALVTTTDSAGHFAFAAVPPGTYDIVARHAVADSLGLSSRQPIRTVTTHSAACLLISKLLPRQSLRPTQLGRSPSRSHGPPPVFSFDCSFCPHDHTALPASKDASSTRMVAQSRACPLTSRAIRLR